MLTEVSANIMHGLIKVNNIEFLNHGYLNMSYFKSISRCKSELLLKIILHTIFKRRILSNLQIRIKKILDRSQYDELKIKRETFNRISVFDNIIKFGVLK